MSESKTGDGNLMEKLVALCKRRGFIFPSSEIYGGIGGFWDYGPLGVELKRNIKNQWWRDMVTNPPDGPDGKELEMVGLDCTIIMNPKVWEASGHLGGFADPMQTCLQCRKLHRADQVVPELIGSAWFVALGKQLQRDAGNVFNANVVADWAVSNTARKLAPGLVDAVTELPIHVAELGQHALDFVRNDKVPPSSHFCPHCGGQLTEPRAFNLMNMTKIGAMEDSSSIAYLRPETAQGIFVNFLNVVDTSRVKLPFGIAQVGKSFRNEINPRNFTFRSREFEQMEIEFFCSDESSMDWYQFWRTTRYNWYVNLGLKSEKLRLRDQGKDELAHYSSACADIEYLFPFSDEHQELEGVAHRGCYDLTQHSKHSGKDLSYFDDDRWQADAAKYKDDKDAAKAAKAGPPYRFMPTVIEPSAGADRAALAFLCEAYCEEQVGGEGGKSEMRTVMKFHPKLAPVKAAFFPLVNKEGMPERAMKLYRAIRKRYNVFYDDKGAIGRRYRRQDEAGTPYCITIDGDTLANGTVTIRDRDSLKQERVSEDQVAAWLDQRLE